MSPLAHYALGEPSGSTQANDSSGNGAPPLTLAGTGTAVTFGTAAGVDGFTAASFAGGKYLSSTASPQVLTAVTVEFFTTFTGSSGGQVFLASADTASLQIATSISGRIEATVNTEVVTSGAGYNDGSLHHVAVTFDAATDDVLLYIDGAMVNSGTSVLSTVSACIRSVGAGFTGSISHVALHSTALSADQIADHYEAGATGFAGETVAERLTRLARYAGMSPSELSFETGRVRDLAPLDTTGKTTLAVMREVEETEGGVLFDALDGTLTFHDRAHRYGATSAFTLSYTDGHIANAIRPVLDDQLQVNDCTCTNADGVTARVIDEASVAEHGNYRQTINLATTDPDEPLLRASWVVNQYAEPLVRVSEVEVNVTQLSNALAAAVLSAQVGTMFTITDLPSNAPNSTMRLFIEGRTDRITQTEDRIIFRTSPAEIYDVFTLGDPDKGLDSGYPLAY